MAGGVMPGGMRRRIALQIEVTCAIAAAISVSGWK